VRPSPLHYSPFSQSSSFAFIPSIPPSPSLHLPVARSESFLVRLVPYSHILGIVGVALSPSTIYFLSPLLSLPLSPSTTHLSLSLCPTHNLVYNSTFTTILNSNLYPFITTSLEVIHLSPVCCYPLKQEHQKHITRLHRSPASLTCIARSHHTHSSCPRHSE
jgi:hypothetical protein